MAFKYLQHVLILKMAFNIFTACIAYTLYTRSQIFIVNFKILLTNILVKYTSIRYRTRGVYMVMIVLVSY